MKQRKIAVVGLLYCVVAGVIGELLFQKQNDLTSLINEELGLPSSTAEEALLAACEETKFDDVLYLAAVHCDQSYVVCQSGSVVYSRVCPPGTRFHLDRRTCLDEQLCLGDQRSVDRDPRQIKFSLDDAFTNNDAWNPGRVAGRRIRFKALQPLDSYTSGYDTAPEGLVRRQIKFRSLPEEFNSESAVPDDPPTPYDDDRRRPRQIKFRSLAERAVERNKHEDRRQVTFDALSNSDDQPLMTYGTDPLNTLYYRRR